MKIISLKSENFKRLLAVEIKPDGNIVAITGRNGSGKTSVLDSIIAALCGGHAIPEKAIRDGQERAEIVIELDGYTVTRTITAKGTTVKVETTEGNTKRSPQAFLDEIVGKIAFDPMDFFKQPAKEKKALLAELVGLDLYTHDKRIGELEDRRRNLRARFDAVEANFKTELVGEEPINPPNGIADIQIKIAEADKVNAAYAAAEADIGALRGDLTRIQTREKALLAELDTIRKQIKEATDAAVKAAAYLHKMQRVDVTDLMAEVENGRQYAEKIKNRNEAIRVHKIAAVAKDAVVTAETDLQAARDAQVAAIAAAKFPVPGISFSSDGVLFKGIPVEQICDSEKIRLGIAVSMALNPTLRVIRLTDGSLLDSTSWAEIEAMAKEKDYQVWIEKVDESGKIGFYIEDGEIKGGK